MAAGRALRIAAASAALLGLAACEDPDFYDDAPPPNSRGLEPGEVPHLTAAEARIYLTDSTLVHRDDDRTWTVYVDPTGELRGLSESRGPDGGAIRARGEWRIEPDGLVCRVWEGVWHTEDEGCAYVRQQGQNYLFAPVESPDDPLVRRREAGNPRGL